MSGRAVLVRQVGFLFCVIALVVAAAGCATGTEDDPGSVDAAMNPPDAMPAWADAPVTTFPDGHTTTYPDANTNLPDAYVPPTIDAGGTGLFCNTHDECTAADECCFYLLEPPGFCVVGDLILDVCFPAE